MSISERFDKSDAQLKQLTHECDALNERIDKALLSRAQRRLPPIPLKADRWLASADEIAADHALRKPRK